MQLCHDRPEQKGFSTDTTDAEGTPVYVDGLRGSLERTAVRSYLAVQAFMDVLELHGSQRFEQQIQRWYDLTARFPRQLYEMDKDEYLANKRREHSNQLRLQKELNATPAATGAGGGTVHLPRWASPAVPVPRTGAVDIGGATDNQCKEQ